MSSVRVAATTQRIVVHSPSRVSVIPAGPSGPRGPQGVEGPPGPAGSSGATTKRWYGSGPPTIVVGASPGDEYVDTDTGDLYVLV